MRQRSQLRKLESERDVDALFAEPLAIIYKHSTLCPVSATARQEMEAFAATHPDRIVHRVDVIEDRPVSNYVESRSGLRHESPQLLVLRSGELVFSTSHFGVTAKALEASLS